MGIPIYQHENENESLSLENIKKIKQNYFDKLNNKWYNTFNNFSMLLPIDNMNYYYITTVIKIFDDGFPVIKQDSQLFNVGQELELLEYVEYITTKIIIYNIYLTIRNNDNDIIDSITLGEPLLNINL